MENKHIEDECLKSPNNKHYYMLMQSGEHPIYACKYCLELRPILIICSKCGYVL